MNHEQRQGREPVSRYEKRYARARGQRTTWKFVLSLTLVVSAVIAVTWWRARSASGGMGRAFLIDERTCYYGLAPLSYETVRGPRGGLEMTVLADEHGFRMGTRAPSHTLATCRVLALGDSFTLGYWVKGAASWPTQLELALQRKGIRVAVDNGGMQGHTIAHERVAATGRWTSPRHGMVIVATTSNDLVDLLRMQKQGCSLGEAPPSAFDLTLPSAVDRSTLAQVVRNAAARVVVESPGLRSLASKPFSEQIDATQCATARALYEKEIKLLASDLHQHGQHLLVAMLEPPRCVMGSDPSKHTWISAQEIQSWIEGEGGRVMDLYPLFMDERMRLRPHDEHPSAFGHAAIANAVAEKVVTMPGWCGAP